MKEPKRLSPYRRMGFSLAICYPLAAFLVIYQPAIEILAFLVIGLILFGPALFTMMPFAGFSSGVGTKSTGLLSIALGALFEFEVITRLLHDSAIIQFITVMTVSLAIAAVLSLLFDTNKTRSNPSVQTTATSRRF